LPDKVPDRLTNGQSGDYTLPFGEHKTTFRKYTILFQAALNDKIEITILSREF